MSEFYDKLTALQGVIAKFAGTPRNEWDRSFHDAILAFGFRAPLRELENPGDTMIHVESMFGARSNLGYVRFVWGDKDAVVTPAEARKHADRIVETAVAAEADALFIRWAREVLHFNEEQVVAMLRDFRAMRG